jgi:hypothetical protein
MISIKHTGSFDKTTKYFEKARKTNYLSIFEKYAKQGVIELKNATPTDTGLTRDSWDYTIVRTKNGVTIKWNNSNIVDGLPIAIILQYGHGTKNGGFVKGVDYINPALRTTFDKITEEIIREVNAL